MCMRQASWEPWRPRFAFLDTAGHVHCRKFGGRQHDRDSDSPNGDSGREKGPVEPDTGLWTILMNHPPTASNWMAQNDSGRTVEILHSVPGARIVGMVAVFSRFWELHVEHTTFK